MQLVTNGTLYEKYLNRHTGELRDSIWDQLTHEDLRLCRPDAHESNAHCDQFNRAENQDVLPGWASLPPLSTWLRDGALLEERKAEPPRIEDASLEIFRNFSGQFFERLAGKRIAVQLSGGLDTSIIVGLMRELAIPHSLVGLANKRYEFRTESRVQQLLADASDQCALLSHEDFPPYSSLKSVPLHQLPNGNSITYAADRAMANKCTELGIDVLISGGGGDLLLTSALQDQEYSWRPNYFYNTFLREYVYSPLGVDLLPFFADPNIVACTRHLRINQKRDPNKAWARRFFSGHLPRELVEYDYKADFWGIYIDGLSGAKKEISTLNEMAFEITGNPYFSSDNLAVVLNGTLNDCNESVCKSIDARVSLAAWLYGLHSTSSLPPA